MNAFTRLREKSFCLLMMVMICASVPALSAVSEAGEEPLLFAETEYQDSDYMGWMPEELLLSGFDDPAELSDAFSQGVVGGKDPASDLRVLLQRTKNRQWLLSLGLAMFSTGCIAACLRDERIRRRLMWLRALLGHGRTASGGGV